MAGYQTPKINSNGEGMWDKEPAPVMFANTGNPTGMTNLLGGQDPKKVSYNNGGTASGNGGGGGSPDQGTGAANQPSPNQSLLTTGSGGSPDQGKGPANVPSPNQSLLSTRGKSGVGPASAVRKSAFGGTEKGVQIQ